MSSQRIRVRHLGQRSLGVIFIGALLAGLSQVACGGSAPPAEEPPPPPLDTEDSSGAGQVAAASSSAVQKGIDAIQAQDFEKAKQILQDAHDENPADAQAAYYLGVAQENTGDVDGAMQSYKQALESDAKLTEASVNLSAILLDRGDYAGALEVAEKGLVGSPKHGLLLTNKAIALAGAGKKAEALKAYARAVAATPDNLELRYEYAQALAADGQKEKAVEQLREVVTSTEPAVVGAGADLLGQLHEYSECIAGFDRALKAKPDPYLYVRRGVCRHGMKDDAGALQDYQAALDLDANFGPAHYYLGRHYLAAGKKREAREELQKAAQAGAGTPLEAAAKKALGEAR